MRIMGVLLYNNNGPWKELSIDIYQYPPKFLWDSPFKGGRRLGYEGELWYGTIYKNNLNIFFLFYHLFGKFIPCITINKKKNNNNA